MLLAASLFFYAYGEPVYVFLMLASSLFNYFAARLLGICSRKSRKRVLAIAVLGNIGILAVFKYTAFLLTSISQVTEIAIKIPEIVLPIGISFFTFQALSYVIDVYRGRVEIQKNYAKVLLYISFFPQLIAGPIVRYKDIAAEIDGRTPDMKEAAFGFRRFIFGLAKKVLIANTMGAAADAIFAAGPDSLNALSAWIGAIAYLMQIYFDFSGYSDMAIGLGRMFGFHFRENFLHPYASSSIQEFWRRWHISLSSWFKDYVYIPLGGNRKGKGRTILNRWIVFFLTGLWHGANWTFVIWGLFHGFFLMLEEFLPQMKKMPKLLLHLYTMLVVTVGFVIFRADSITIAMEYLGKMFTGFTFSSTGMALAVSLLTPRFLLTLAAAVYVCGPAEKLTEKVAALQDKQDLTVKEERLETLTFLIAWLLLVWCMIRLCGSSYNPFIYFRF